MFSSYLNHCLLYLSVVIVVTTQEPAKHFGAKRLLVRPQHSTVTTWRRRDAPAPAEMLELLCPAMPEPHAGCAGYPASTQGHQGFEKLSVPFTFGTSAKLGFKSGFESVFESSTRNLQVYCSGKHLFKLFFNNSAKHQPVQDQHPALPPS